MVFQNIKKTEKLYVRIAEEINNSIINGVFAEGEKLPPERELASQFGVSRPSIREALAVLEILGVVDIKVGDGSYVKKKEKNFNIELNKIKDTSPFELIEARYHIESIITELAIDRATEQNITVIQETIDLMKELNNEEDLEEFFEQGVRFHRELARSTQNEILFKIAESLVHHDIHPLWKMLNKKALFSEEARLHQIKEHEEILEAIKTKDKDKVKQAMLHHLNHLEDLLLF